MSHARAQGACLFGATAELVTVEASFEPADLKRCELTLSGLPDPVLRESKNRLACALAGVGLALPVGRLHVNLLPAALPKRGELLDLPLALCCAAAAGYLDPRALEGLLWMGELGIDGNLHDVPGGLAVAEAGRRAGFPRLVAPPKTAAEAAHLPRSVVFAARHLGEALRIATDPKSVPIGKPRSQMKHPDQQNLARVRGQALGRHALAVAAAGEHGLLFHGPPGTGKSLLARALPDLLPVPTLEERIEITQVQSAAGAWPGELVRSRPFRSPHHTTSYAGLVGGGNPPRPGEITLAHRGVLFLDELPEFRRETLEALRQPLETGRIVVSRAGERADLPAAFQLVAAMNPCPCGYRGSGSGRCRCSRSQIERYWNRLSGPLLDRIDLHVELPSPDLADLAAGRDPDADSDAPSNPGLAAAKHLSKQVRDAHARAAERQRGRPNRSLDADELDQFCPMRGEARRILKRAAIDYGLSARAIQSLRRVARTLADLAGREQVQATDLAEALALRGGSPLQTAG